MPRSTGVGGVVDDGLVARLLLALRLLLAVLRLPATALLVASSMTGAEVALLLEDALVLRRQRTQRMHTAARRSEQRAFGSSGGSGGDETPCSDDPGVLSDEFGSALGASTTAAGGRSNGRKQQPAQPAAASSSSARGGAPRESSVLVVDVGGTRTKFLLVEATRCTRLPPAPTALIWQNALLSGPDKFEPASAPRRMRDYLHGCGVDMESIGRLAFSVPGTVDLAERTTSSVVKNTPSMSPKFRGFDFKEAFRDVCPTAKVAAVADNLAAALGVACQHPHLRSALVLVLGTAPAVATVFRDPSGKGKYIETAIWQSWVWFTKVKLDDPYGYCGGLKVTREGVTLKPSTAAKIPHHQARIRFALDDATWRRLRGCCEELPEEMQAHLTEAEATRVWCRRLQAALGVLAERFHSIYGPPQEVHVLGGNASRCHGRVTAARYLVPDAMNGQLAREVPVIIPPDDEAQQLLHMSGLVYASCFKLKQVTAPGQDPLARGWTRGGEIYLWVAKGVKTEHEIAWPPVSAVREATASGGTTASTAAGARHTSEDEEDAHQACVRRSGRGRARGGESEEVPTSE